MKEPEQCTADLEALFRECRPDLERYFARRHGGPEGADDLVQESFLQLARGVKERKAVSSPRAYLFGIARHLSLAFLRKRTHAVATADETEQEPLQEEMDSRVQAAREVIATLPELQREILDLRFAHDLSYLEIATVLGIPVGTVRSRLHHAIGQVRERLKAENTETHNGLAVRTTTYFSNEN